MNKVTFQKSVVKPPPPRLATWWMNTETDELFFLSKTDTESYFLTSVRDGEYWSWPNREIDRVFGNSRKLFVQITDPFTITPQPDPK